MNAPVGGLGEGFAGVTGSIERKFHALAAQPHMRRARSQIEPGEYSALPDLHR